MVLSLVLSTIHSQIVATASSSGSTEKRKRILQPKRKKPERVRRRKKINRVRSSDIVPEVGEVAFNATEPKFTLWPADSTNGLRKRNVNWDSPIKSHGPIQPYRSVSVDRLQPNLQPVPAPATPAGDDDGFESLNGGKSSSGEDNAALLQRSTALDAISLENLAAQNLSSTTRQPFRNVGCGSDSDTDTLKATQSMPKVLYSNMIQKNS